MLNGMHSDFEIIKKYGRSSQWVNNKYYQSLGQSIRLRFHLESPKHEIAMKYQINIFYDNISKLHSRMRIYDYLMRVFDD